MLGLNEKPSEKMLALSKSATTQEERLAAIDAAPKIMVEEIQMAVMENKARRRRKFWDDIWPIWKGDIISFAMFFLLVGSIIGFVKWWWLFMAWLVGGGSFSGERLGFRELLDSGTNV